MFITKKTVIECGKRVKYIYWIKKDLFECFRIEEIRGKDNETGLKKGGGIKILTTVLILHSQCSLLRFEYLLNTYHRGNDAVSISCKFLEPANGSVVQVSS